MAFSPSSPITGTAQTGLTSPTYTHVSDTAPDINGKQVVVTALGGTQTGVNVASVQAPFTLTFWRPKTLKSQASPNSQGLYVGNPLNVYKLVCRKGMAIASGQYRNAVFTATFEVPVGAETYSPAEVRAAASAFIGLLSQQSAGVGDTLCTGVV